MSSHQNVPYQSAFADMDESFKVNRWANGTSEDGVQNYFMRYTSGHQSSRQQVDTLNGESNRKFTTQVTYSNYADKFKKMKYNQMETLKQLRQEYQILRNLPLQDEFLRHSHHKKQSVSEYSSQQEAESSSASSKPVHKKKIRESQGGPKDNQVLSMQKRQLELVIGNSMRKIEQLLNSQIEYKKIIHDLQLQLDSRNGDQKLENLTKTMKKNQSDLIEKIQNLKRDIERLKLINQQLLDKNDLLEVELHSRNQELKKYRDEKRMLEDSVRLQKDKYMNLEIEIKRIKMEFTILEKDKNNQINRLKGLLQTQSIGGGASQAELRRVQDQLKTQKHKYQMLLHQFENYKRDLASKPKQVVVKEVKDPHNGDQLKIFETLISHLKQDSANQSRQTMDLISSMVLKMDEKAARQKQRQRQERERERERQKNKKREKERPIDPQAQENSNKLLEAMFNLRNQVTTLKRDRERQDPNQSKQFISNLTQSMADYQRKIRKLQEQITDGSITKENLLKEYQIMKSSYEMTKDQYEKLLTDYQELKARLGHFEHLQKYGQNSNEQMKTSFRERESQLEQTIRQLRRQLDQALFMVEKAKKEGQFNVTIARNQSQSRTRLAQQKAERLNGEKEVFRQELSKMRAYYESKIKQKNDQLQKTAQQFSSLCETKEKALSLYKSNSETEMNVLLRKIQGIASLNQRYILQSNQLASAERQLHELRYAIRRMKGMNEGVDHLWQIKQTQYLNVNELLRQTRLQ